MTCNKCALGTTAVPFGFCVQVANNFSRPVAYSILFQGVSFDHFLQLTSNVDAQMQLVILKRKQQ